jgi:hypothetical protein
VKRADSVRRRLSRIVFKRICSFLGFRHFKKGEFLSVWLIRENSASFFRIKIQAAGCSENLVPVHRNTQSQMPKQRDVKQGNTQNLSKGVADPEVLYNLFSFG